MKLFDEKHKKQMEENSKELESNLRKRVAQGSDGSLFGNIGQAFAKNLLHDMETRRVIKK